VQCFYIFLPSCCLHFFFLFNVEVVFLSTVHNVQCSCRFFIYIYCVLFFLFLIFPSHLIYYLMSSFLFALTLEELVLFMCYVCVFTERGRWHIFYCLFLKMTLEWFLIWEFFIELLRNFFVWEMELLCSFFGCSLNQEY